MKLATEVLPLVPVTATITSGWSPYQRLAATDSARRGCSWTMTGTATRPIKASARASPAASVRIAAAPMRRAKGMKSAPWVFDPGSATKRCPACTSRLSTDSPVSSGSTRSSRRPAARP